MPQSLAIEEVDLAVERLGVDVGHLADAPHGRFVHQEGEDSPVLGRGLVTGGGFADSEGLLAGFAAVAPGAGMGETKGLVKCCAGRHWGAVVSTGIIRARGLLARVEGGEEASAFFEDRSVALDRRLLATAVATQQRG